MKLILDRFEGDFAILTDDECRVYEIRREMLPADAGEDDAFEGKLSDGKIVSVAPCENPDAGKNAERLRALIEKSKK